MKMLRITLVCSITLLSLLGCASKQVVIQPFDKSVTVEKSYDDVWSSLIRFLSVNAISIATIEKESGLIQLKGETLSRQLIQEYCAAQPNMLQIVDNGNANGSITVIEEDGFVTVNANMRFSFVQRPSMGNPVYTTLQCPSTGKFETALLNSVK